MCGIAGVVLTKPGPVGRYLVDMIGAVQHRGPDSTGFGLYGDAGEGEQVCLRVLGADGAEDLLGRAVAGAAEAGAAVVDGPHWDLGVAGATDRFVRFRVGGTYSVRELLFALERPGGVEVHSIGASLRLVKDVGTAHDVSARHGIDGFVGTHGVAHCRLATESEVDVAHSHPFWARGTSDISVVHNGQITNYHKLRRILEEQGYDFATRNDSELIAVYVAAKLHEGASLEEALFASIDELDGCFTYFVCTPDGIGMAKDPLAAKPLVIGEADGITAMASEEGALHEVFGDGFKSFSPGEREVITWSTSMLKV